MVDLGESGNILFDLPTPEGTSADRDPAHELSLVGEWEPGSDESAGPQTTGSGTSRFVRMGYSFLQTFPSNIFDGSSSRASTPQIGSLDDLSGQRHLAVYFQADVPVNASPIDPVDVGPSIRPSSQDIRMLVGLEAVRPQEQQRDKWTRAGTRQHTNTLMETMWEADQPRNHGFDIEMEDSIEDVGGDVESAGHDDGQGSQGHEKGDQVPRLGITPEADLIKSKSLKAGKNHLHVRIVTPRVKEEAPSHTQAIGVSYPQTPPMKYPQTPSTLIKQNDKAWINTIQTPVRTVSQDYPVPQWMLNTNVLAPNYHCPYKYTRTFKGKYGVVNYDMDGNPQDTLVLCFHGLNASRLTYQEIQEVFAKYNYCVVTFDLYGHGLSASPVYRDRCTLLCGCQIPEKTTYSLDFYVEQAQELLEHLSFGDRPVSLIGFSMGGVVAAGFAKAYPERVERLVLISTAGALAPKPPASVRLLRNCTCCIPCVPGCICRCCCDRKRFMKKFSKEELESGMAEALWQRLMWQLFVKKGVIEAFLGSVANVPLWGAKDIFQQVGRTGIPTLILWGRADAVAPVSGAKTVLNSFDNGHLIIFDHCSHLLLADQPQAVVALLLTFLEFPRTCKLEEWRYLLPFTPRGVYVPRENRCPEGLTAKEFLEILQFKPRLMVRLPKSPTRPQSPSGDTTRDTERRSTTE